MPHINAPPNASPSAAAVAGPSAADDNKNQKKAVANQKTTDNKKQQLESEHYYSRGKFFTNDGKYNKKRRNSEILVNNVTYTCAFTAAEQFRCTRFFTPPASAVHYLPELCVKTSHAHLSTQQKLDWEREQKILTKHIQAKQNYFLMLKIKAVDYICTILVTKI